MAYISMVLVGLVALEHVYILVLEMYLWTTPRALRVFGNTKEFAQSTKVMAANQGLYNGFLAAGLFWGLFHPESMIGFQIQVFFLLCVLVAAVYGAYSVKRSILFIQGLPAALALVSLLIFG